MIWSIDFDVGTGSGLPGDSEEDPADDGPGTDLVWVSPEVWDQPNPQAYCAFPCTVVLPPYTKVTTTSVYPLVTITSSGYTTTITRPPMTISVWWISTLVIGPSNSGQPTSGGQALTSGQASQGPRTITTDVTFITTTTWPGFTTTDSTGREGTSTLTTTVMVNARVRTAILVAAKAPAAAAKQVSSATFALGSTVSVASASTMYPAKAHFVTLPLV
jgi:hypothetical protein